MDAGAWPGGVVLDELMLNAVLFRRHGLYPPQATCCGVRKNVRCCLVLLFWRYSRHDVKVKDRRKVAVTVELSRFLYYSPHALVILVKGSNDCSILFDFLFQI